MLLSAFFEEQLGGLYIYRAELTPKQSAMNFASQLCSHDRGSLIWHSLTGFSILMTYLAKSWLRSILAGHVLPEYSQTKLGIGFCHFVDVEVEGAFRSSGGPQVAVAQDPLPTHLEQYALSDDR